jgi:glycosyltransferase involved in cell wall biosynthesis
MIIKGRKKLMILTDWFYPGFRAGGTATTCYNLAMLIKKENDVYILTSDRDFGTKDPYTDITVNQWVKLCENVHVLYSNPAKLNFINILGEVRSLSPDCIYLNSMYSVRFSIYPIMMKRLGLNNMTVVLSPSGMLKDSAIQIKALKKKLFLFVLKALRIQNVIKFHATDEQEKADIYKYFGPSSSVNQIPYVPPVIVYDNLNTRKVSGALKIVFTGRIHPVKNLHFVIECLRHSKHKIILTIVGPVEDQEYFKYCKTLESALPENINLNFVGEVPNNKIQQFLNENHFLILPSLGENYGYSIIEALLSGRPVIISDKTPWRNLFGQKAGWDLPLSKPQEFFDAINIAAAMDQEEYDKWSEGAIKYGRSMINRPLFHALYNKMFGFIPG